VGRPNTRRRSLSSGLGHPAPHHRQCQGSAAPGRQRVRPGPSCSGDATSSHAGAIHHRGTAYLGRTQGSPGRRRGSTSRELCLLETSRPLGAPCGVLSTHAGSLGPSRARAGRDTRRSGSLKGKCALGPFLSILVIECQRKCFYANLCKVVDKVKIL
jgi:hypothetical protein